MNALQPRVSVLVPVYDAMPWLPVAVGSVLTQTFTDYELLLVDDGSTDGSGAWCDALAARDARVRVLRHPSGVNRGQVASMNLGLDEARAAYVARLDSDDIAYPTRLEKQVATLDAHPGVALVGSQIDWAGPAGTTRWQTPTEPYLARWTLLVDNCFMHGGVTFRTEVVRALGGYDAAFAPAEDYDLWLRIAERHSVVNLPETLAWFNNLRTDNLSTVHAEKQRACGRRAMVRAVQRYVPNAADETVATLDDLAKGRGWPGAIVPDDAYRRLAEAGRLLCRLRDAFLTTERPPLAARRTVEADVRQRMMRLRFETAQLGPIGQLARLCRPRWDRQARLLQLPALLSR